MSQLETTSAHTCHHCIMKTPADGVENAAASDSSCMFTPCWSRQSARRWRECGRMRGVFVSSQSAAIPDVCTQSGARLRELFTCKLQRVLAEVLMKRTLAGLYHLLIKFMEKRQSINFNVPLETKHLIRLDWQFVFYPDKKSGHRFLRKAEMLR